MLLHNVLGSESQSVSLKVCIPDACGEDTRHSRGTGAASRGGVTIGRAHSAVAYDGLSVDLQPICGRGGPVRVYRIVDELLCRRKVELVARGPRPVDSLPPAIPHDHAHLARILGHHHFRRVDIRALAHDISDARGGTPSQ